MNEREIFPAYEEYLQPARIKCAYGGRGSAKCLGKGTKVIMADASLRAIEYVRVGEQVMGADGMPRNVLSVANGIGELYQITQKTGMSYVVNDAHIMVFERSKSSAEDYGTFSAAGKPQRPNGRYSGYDTGKGYSLITAKEYHEKPERFKNQHYGFRRAIIGENKALPLDPYLLGLWLGDGSSKAPEITTIDAEIKDYIYAISASNGWTVKPRSEDKAAVYYIGNEYSRDGSLTSMLKTAGVWKNKHIPEGYFGASIEQRRQLLAGIIDTDGHIANGTVEISQSSEAMIDGIIRLAHGLGMKASKTKTSPVCANNGKVCIAWKTHIGGDIDNIPLKIERKKKRAVVNKNKDWRRTKVDIEPIGAGEYYGFELDGDHLFMLEDGTITHNTRTFISILTDNVLFYGWRLACFRETMKSLDDSVYQEFVDEIERSGYSPHFNILQSEIQAIRSGGVIKFDGLKGNTQKLKGYASFDAAWVEEAENVSRQSWTALIPTLRKDNSELWVSFNPNDPLSDTYKRFVSERAYPDYKDGRRYCISKQINYTDNPRFPKELADDLELMKANDFELYRHVYLGEPVRNSDLAIIKPMWVQSSIDAHIKLGITPYGGKIGGFDVADSGEDFNAYIIRHGIAVVHSEEWKDLDAVAAARYIHAEALRGGIDLVRYDDIGVGVAAKGVFREEQENLLNSGARGFHRTYAEGFCAGGSVVSPDSEYMAGKTNGDAFLNLKAQAWYMLADRFKNTHDAINGKPYDPEKLISLSSGLPNLSKLTAELSQPRREYSNYKQKVESKADMKKRGVSSPNLADALVMAFAPESSFNLSALL